MGLVRIKRGRGAISAVKWTASRRQLGANRCEIVSPSPPVATLPVARSAGTPVSRPPSSRSFFTLPPAREPPPRFRRRVRQPATARARMRAPNARVLKLSSLYGFLSIECYAHQPARPPLHSAVRALETPTSRSSSTSVTLYAVVRTPNFGGGNRQIRKYIYTHERSLLAAPSVCFR